LSPGGLDARHGVRVGSAQFIAKRLYPHPAGLAAESTVLNVAELSINFTVATVANLDKFTTFLKNQQKMEMAWTLQKYTCKGFLCKAFSGDVYEHSL